MCANVNETKEIEIERRNRLRLSLAAYAYELRSTSIMSDAEFDSLAQKIDTSLDTGHVVMDAFFKESFSSHTGQWVWKHPEIIKLGRLYDWLVERNVFTATKKEGLEKFFS